MHAQQVSFPAPNLIGAFGPAYQVLQPVQPLEDGDWVVKVRILETGEEVDYRYARIMDDPQAT